MRRAGLAAFGALALIAGGPASAGEALQRLSDIAPALARCWTPPAIEGGGEVTVRLSFTSRGAIIGAPRVSYSRAVAPEQRRQLRDSLLSALARCGPLAVSPSLGAAIAGRIFAIRFIVTNRKGQNI